MTVYQNLLWGYEITYPDSWIHQQAQDTEIFTSCAEALDPEYSGPGAGQIMMRAEWNPARQKIEPLWNQHIGKLASMLGAKNVGSAPWRLRDAVGLEAEIVLPKKDNRRLWTGVLMRGFSVFHFMVTHPKEIREEFEPVATKLIASLRFPAALQGIMVTPEGLPLPPNYAPVDPQTVLEDIADPQVWRAYSGDAEVGALQAFYLRELPALGWNIAEFAPFPGSSGLGFARFQLRRENTQLLLGVMPPVSADSNPGPGRANVVVKINPV